MSDVVAQQVVRVREGIGLTRAQLAERCGELGWPGLTYGVISTIETGRRDSDGRRRREISIDELVVLARALGVPPALLVTPLGYTDSVEVLPGVELRTLHAYEYLVGGFVAADDEYVLALKPRRSDPAVSTYQEYETAVARWIDAGHRGDHGETRIWGAQVQLLQDTMQENGWRIPPLPSDDRAGKVDDDDG